MLCVTVVTVGSRSGHLFFSSRLRLIHSFFFFGLIHPRVLLYIVALSVPVVCCVNAVLDVRFVRSS